MATPVVTWDTHWVRHWRLAWDYLLGGAVVSFLLTYGICMSQRPEGRARTRYRGSVAQDYSSRRQRRNSFDRRDRELEREPRYRHHDGNREHRSPRDEFAQKSSHVRSPGGRRRDTSDPDVDYSD